MLQNVVSAKIAKMQADGFDVAGRIQSACFSTMSETIGLIGLRALFLRTFEYSVRAGYLSPYSKAVLVAFKISLSIISMYSYRVLNTREENSSLPCKCERPS